MFKQKNKFKKGFGLLEVLLSGVIIILILGALVTIGHAAVRNSEYVAERTQAIYLAQEGLETVRQIRDTNWIDQSNTTQWNSLTGSGPVNSNYCFSITSATRFLLVSGTSITLANCKSASKQSLTIDQITYNRKIYIELNPANLLPATDSSDTLRNNSMKVTSIVTWTFNGQSKSVEGSEILTNWRPDF